MKKIKPLFKVPNSKWHAHSWVIEHFPENYKELSYLEPFVGDGTIIFNKERSAAEFVNDADEGVVQILRCLRDETNHFISRLKKTKYSETSFNKIIKKNVGNHVDLATREYVLRRMSRSGKKTNFIDSDANQEAWLEAIAELPRVGERLSDVHIFNKSPLEVIRAFDEENILIYINTPDSSDNLVSTDAHVELAGVLNNFRGKVVLSGKATAFYKRLYAEWKCVKKKFGEINECLWLNF